MARTSDQLNSSEVLLVQSLDNLSDSASNEFLAKSGGVLINKQTTSLGYVPYTGATSDVDLGANNLTVDTNTLFVDAVNHRVGIGTLTTTGQLTIYKESSAKVRIYAGDNGTSSFDFFEGTPTVNPEKDGFRVKYDGANNALKIHAVASHVEYETRGITILRESGNVGIGNASPSQILHLERDNADVGIALTETGGANWHIGLDYSNSNYLSIGNSATIGTNAIMTITTTGSVGIGTTAPTRTIGIGGNSARTFGLERHTTSNTAGNSLTINAGGATSGATNKNGGTLYLDAGLATGTGYSLVTLRTAPPSTTGTADNALADVMEFGNVVSTLYSDLALGGYISLPAGTVTIADIAETTAGTSQYVFRAGSTNAFSIAGTESGGTVTPKLGLYNATPVARHSSTGETAGFVQVTGTTVTELSTFTGNVGSTAYNLNDIVKALKNLGVLAV